VDSSLAYAARVGIGEPGALAVGDDGSVRLFGAVRDSVRESNLQLDTRAETARGRAPFTREISVKPASLDANTRRIISADSGGYLKWLQWDGWLDEAASTGWVIPYSGGVGCREGT
jgi:hypothetical protein